MSRLSDDVSVLAEAATLLTTPLNIPASIAGASVTDPAAATASDPSAATASNPTTPAAFTVPLVAQAVTVVSESATDLDDVAAALKVLHTETITYEASISANIVDIAGNRTEVLALIVDVADIRTQLSALLTSLEAAGLIAT